MASVDEGALVLGEKNTSSEGLASSASAMDDSRGFTTAGRDYVPPVFSIGSDSPQKRRRRSTTTDTTTTTSSSRLRPSPIPAISLEELDLDSTVEAGESYLSSSSEDEGIVQGRGGRASSYMDSTITNGTHSKAMKKGMLSVTTSHLVCLLQLATEHPCNFWLQSCKSCRIERCNKGGMQALLLPNYVSRVVK